MKTILGEAQAKCRAQESQVFWQLGLKDCEYRMEN